MKNTHSLIILIISLFSLNCGGLNPVFMIKGACTVYNKAPVDVYYTDEYRMEIGVVHRAIDTINEKAGCMVFFYPQYVSKKPECYDGCVTVKSHSITEISGALCSFYTNGNCKIVRAEITIPNAYGVWDTLHNMVVHEFLHALGFAHNDVPGQIMHPNASMAGSTFTDEQLEALRWYCK